MGTNRPVIAGRACPARTMPQSAVSPVIVRRSRLERTEWHWPLASSHRTRLNVLRPSTSWLPCCPWLPPSNFRIDHCVRRSLNNALLTPKTYTGHELKSHLSIPVHCTQCMQDARSARPSVGSKWIKWTPVIGPRNVGAYTIPKQSHRLHGLQVRWRNPDRPSRLRQRPVERRGCERLDVCAVNLILLCRKQRSNGLQLHAYQPSDKFSFATEEEVFQDLGL
ncbi:hypothetical protein EJ03DRAFT_196060 [Teratosphaeria nubilosa]|uniref:Uncharacterized protein n=1 Tax=Teratosphaeria nubilosa TaxID=161662 RepID=A0A6G1KYU0_9PEZI|nr:hypothetical protein EJ03DRAFT_196060 [Teratosphaeria nubilosa]